MSQNCGLEAVDLYKNDKILLKQPKLKMAIMRNVPIKQIIYLRSALERKASQINNQNGIPI